MIYLFLGFLINIYIFFLQWCLYFSLLLIIKYESSSTRTFILSPFEKRYFFFSLSRFICWSVFISSVILYIYWNRLNLLLHIPDLKLSLNFSHIFFLYLRSRFRRKRERERIKIKEFPGYFLSKKK